MPLREGMLWCQAAETWGFQDVLFKGQPIQLVRPLESYVMENILFKISFPAEFHAQTAVEAAMTLHQAVKDKLDEIDEIIIETQEAGVRIIDKTGPLDNPADRDHCIQYMTAIPLIFGRLNADDYEDAIAADPRIDKLRGKMKVTENRQFSIDYLDPSKRAIGNAIQIKYSDGSSTDRVEVLYPIGHRRRRQEGIPVLLKKFENSLAGRFDNKHLEDIVSACSDQASLEALPVADFMQLWSTGVKL